MLNKFKVLLQGGSLDLRSLEDNMEPVSLEEEPKHLSHFVL